jgi:hypothetical protein
LQFTVRSLRGLGILLAAGLLVTSPMAAHATPVGSDDSAAVAAAPIPLPLPSFGGIEVTGKYVIIAGGPSADGLVVTNLDGGDVRKEPVGASATDIALSRDRRTLYAVIRNTAEIVAINTSTFRVKARYPTGTCPETVAVTDRVWFGYGCGSSESSGIGVIDVGSPNPTVKLGVSDGVRYYDAPTLATARDANVLIAGEGGSPATLTSFSQAPDGSLKRLAETRDAGSNLGDLAVTPDGSTVYTACGAPYEILAFAVNDLSPRGRMATQPYPSAVSVSPRGDRLAGGSNATYDPDVFVFDTKNPVPQPPIELGYALELYDRGLAWSTNSKKLFAVTDSPDNSNTPQLHVLTP